MRDGTEGLIELTSNVLSSFAGGLPLLHGRATTMFDMKMGVIRVVRSSMQPHSAG